MARPRSACAGLALTLTLALAGSASAATVVDAGSLHARVTEDPWSLALTYRGGRVMLSEDGGMDPGRAARLGFRTAPGWQHATRVTESQRGGGGYTARLATTDPARE